MSEMTHRHNHLNRFARLAGLAYLVTILLGLFSVNVVAARLIVPGDSAVTSSNILANESLYRLGLSGEVLMYALVILLAHALYVVLRTVDRDLALLALLWRLAEAIVGSAATVISGLLPLLLLTTETSLSGPQLNGLVGSLLALRGVALDIVLIFIGLGGTLFCYLFFKSGYIPRVLALWGVVTYTVMFVLSFLSLLFPIADTTKMLFYAPGGVFEISLGLWLLIKGVNVEIEVAEGFKKKAV